MAPVLTGLLLLLLLAAVVIRRLRINSIERRLAATQASTREASTFLVFIRELKTAAADPAREGALLIEDIVALIAKAAGATSGAFFRLAQGELLERVAVVGAHPTQVHTEAPMETHAARVAAALGDESVRMAHGPAGRAATGSRTAIEQPKGGTVARIAIPVHGDSGVAGVVSLAGPCCGGGFAPGAIAFVERLIAAATPALLENSP